MATEPTKYVGKIDCPVCGESMPVRQNGRDTLNVSCLCCGISSYAKGGTQAHSIVTGWLRLRDPASPEKQQPGSVAPVASSAEGAAEAILKATKKAFSLEAL